MPYLQLIRIRNALLIVDIDSRLPLKWTLGVFTLRTSLSPHSLSAYYDASADASKQINTLRSTRVPHSLSD